MILIQWLNGKQQQHTLDFYKHLARVGIIVLGVGGGVLVDTVVGEVHVNVANTRTVVAVLVRREPAKVSLSSKP